MNNYLMLDGKKYELSDDLIAALRPAVAEPEKKNPFEKKLGEDFYYIGSNGFVLTSYDANFPGDKERYAVANYCTDKALMEQRAMHEILNRLLWRYSEEHGGDNPWKGANEHWFIMMEDGNLKTNYFCYSAISGVIYFKDRETALSAIEEVVKPFMATHSDFVW